MSTTNTRNDNDNNINDLPAVPSTATATSSGTATPHDSQAPHATEHATYTPPTQPTRTPSRQPSSLPIIPSASTGGASTSNTRDSLHLAKARIPTPPQAQDRGASATGSGSQTPSSGGGSQEAGHGGAWSMLTRLRSRSRLGADAGHSEQRDPDATLTRRPSDVRSERSAAAAAAAAATPGTGTGTPYAATLRQATGNNAAGDVESQASSEGTGHAGRRVRGIRDVGTALVLAIKNSRAHLITTWVHVPLGVMFLLVICWSLDLLMEKAPFRFPGPVLGCLVLFGLIAFLDWLEGRLAFAWRSLGIWEEEDVVVVSPPVRTTDSSSGDAEKKSEQSGSPAPPAPREPPSPPRKPLIDPVMALLAPPCDFLLRNMSLLFTPSFILIPLRESIPPKEIGIIAGWFIATQILGYVIPVLICKLLERIWGVPKRLNDRLKKKVKREYRKAKAKRAAGKRGDGDGAGAPSDADLDVDLEKEGPSGVVTAAASPTMQAKLAMTPVPTLDGMDFEKGRSFGGGARLGPIATGLSGVTATIVAPVSHIDMRRSSKEIRDADRRRHLAGVELERARQQGEPMPLLWSAKSDGGDVRSRASMGHYRHGPHTPGHSGAADDETRGRPDSLQGERITSDVSAFESLGLWSHHLRRGEHHHHHHHHAHAHGHAHAHNHGQSSRHRHAGPRSISAERVPDRKRSSRRDVSPLGSRAADLVPDDGANASGLLDTPQRRRFFGPRLGSAGSGSGDNEQSPAVYPSLANVAAPLPSPASDSAFFLRRAVSFGGNPNKGGRTLSPFGARRPRLGGANPPGSPLAAEMRRDADAGLLQVPAPRNDFGSFDVEDRGEDAIVPAHAFEKRRSSVATAVPGSEEQRGPSSDASASGQKAPFAGQDDRIRVAGDATPRAEKQVTPAPSFAVPPATSRRAGDDGDEDDDDDDEDDEDEGGRDARAGSDSSSTCSSSSDADDDGIQRLADRLADLITPTVYFIVFIVGLGTWFGADFALPLFMSINVLTFWLAITVVPPKVRRFAHPILTTSAASVLLLWAFGAMRSLSLKETLGYYSRRAKYNSLWSPEGYRGPVPGTGDVLGSLLDAGIVALFVPLYRYRKDLRECGLRIFVALIVPVLLSLFVWPTLSALIGLDGVRALAFAPRFLSTPLAIEMVNTLGGDESMTVILVVVTGIVAAILKEPFFRLMRVDMDDHLTVGVTFGATSGAIGASSLIARPRVMAVASLGFVMFGAMCLALTAVPSIVVVVRDLAGV